MIPREAGAGQIDRLPLPGCVEVNMKDRQIRNIKVALTEDECDALCEMAAEYNIDVCSFVTKICRDIVELGVQEDSRRVSLRYLDQYLDKRFHDNDDGFLTYLFANDKFEDTILKLKELRQPSVADMQEEEEAFLKQVYSEYEEILQDSADSYETSMRKLENAYVARKSLSKETAGNE